MPAVKIDAVIQKVKHWETIAAQFYNYKLFGDLPAIFGRDEKLDLSEMHHIHLASTEAT
jgi:mRNA interferase YafO